MGHIRASAIYGNPRYEFCGIVDTNVDGAAAKLGELYRVRFDCIFDCMTLSTPLTFISVHNIFLFIFL